MDTHSQENELQNLLHEEKHEDLKLVYFENAAASLQELSNKIVANLNTGDGDDPAYRTFRQLLENIHRLSEAWSRLSGTERQGSDDLWEQLLDACYELELEALKLDGYTELQTKKLVRRLYGWWDHVSQQFDTGSLPPPCTNHVPVIVVQRGVGFTMHEVIRELLWDHPAFVGVRSRPGLGLSPRETFESTLGLIGSIKQAYCFSDWEDFPSPGELNGPDRSAVDCIYGDLDLFSLLDPNETRGGDFLENKAPSNGEDLAWLREAKKGDRLWELLNTAVKLGRSLNHYETFRDSNIQEVVRKAHSTGRPTSEEGEAVERIIREATKEGLVPPTAKRLLKWLGGERTKNWSGPLIVSHPLWVPALHKIDWSQFYELVKAARRRPDLPPGGEY